VASDESYRDPTNLKGKLQKHQAFEAEVTANRKRVDVVSAVSRFLQCSDLNLCKAVRASERYHLSEPDPKNKKLGYH